MGGSTTFDQIAQAIQEQQWLMEELEKENNVLKSQLAALRNGHGLVITIGTAQFELQDQFVAVAPQEIAISEAPQEIAISEAPQDQAPEQGIIEQQEAPTATLAALPAVDPQTATFLEEIMIDEFSVAMTNPMAVWTGPQQQPATPAAEPEKSADMDEEQKAILRRELMGSFLLE